MSNPDGSLGDWSELNDLPSDNEQPWPPRDVLRRLAEFADYQLQDRGYDGHGHEELQHCVDRAYEILGEQRAWPVEGRRARRLRLRCPAKGCTVCV